MAPRGVPSAEAVREPLFAGRYELLGKVGRGGMGTVYRARDTLVGDVVALKVLEVGEEGQRRELLERFRREVRLARRISHPHVARTHDLGGHEGHLFLTMEYVEGEDLQALLRREQVLAPVRAARIALAVCEGLAAAHAAGVVHRDLKPANVLVETGGRVVLTDFGIARAVAEKVAARTQGMVGTPMYMSPEQLGGAEVDARSDLYATGLLLYEMLTGEAPFSGESPMAVAFARLRQPPPDPGRRPGVPDALAEVVRRCVAREPEERPSGASEVAAALRGWLSSVGEGGESVTGFSTPVPGASATGWVTPLPTPTPPGSQGTPGTWRPTPSTPLRPCEQGLAVLPLRFMGPKEQEFLGDAATEGLIDVLSRTRGILVQGSGATARFRNERDPRLVGRELGVGFVVDGTVQSLGKVVRASPRLVEVASGAQLWSGRFEVSGEDVFALSDRLGLRMAEALRTELLIASYRGVVPAEALTLYRQALSQVYTSPRNLPEDVIEPLEAYLEQAPGFLPGIALHAVATLRMWFVRSLGEQRDWEAVARSSMERALRQAPEMPETQLARAMLAVQSGDWRTAVAALRAALETAPTFAPALQYLGTLQCEAGRADEALERLSLAYELNPGLAIALVDIARCNALRGRMEDYRRATAQLMMHPLVRMMAILLRLRVASWMGDREEGLRCKAELKGEPSAIAGNALHYAAAVLGEEDPGVALASFDAILAMKVNSRFSALICQLATEMLCMTGQVERAMEYFQRAADTSLIDLEWVDRCPALAPLRELPGFTEGRIKVRTRVEAIWAA